MKEVRTVKMIESVDVKFVADDGKEFVGENAERNCRDYERTCDKKKVEKEFERVEFTELDMPFIDWLSDETAFYKATLNSKRDFVAMMDYFNVVWGVFDNDIKEPIAYPCTMIISYAWESVCEYNRDIKAELEKALAQLN